MESKTNIVWLRRDLRLYDHAAFTAALKENVKIQPVFVFDTNILSRFPNLLDKRISFLAETLVQMNEELKKLGGKILIFHGDSAEIIPRITEELAANKVFAAEDFEPAPIKRDKKVKEVLAKNGKELVLVKDHLIKTPRDVLKGDGTPFKVFTPYSKAWLSSLKNEDMAERKVQLNGRLSNKKINLKTLTTKTTESLLSEMGYKYSDLSNWPPEDAKKRLGNFIRTKVMEYKENRNFPAEPGTSRISPYLRFGLISIRECMREVYGRPNTETWVSELIWREFYAMILYHFPNTPNEEFLQQYRGTIKWSQDAELLEKWKNGETGFPIVDAAMRELKTDWWMHNRSRMIVASFLTKDLLIDWRLGEEHFAQYLMDYEQASNVGGWQWAASTGTDASPYFRVFNPKMQSEKFDGDGKYIKKYVPELKNFPTKEIHAPSDFPLLAKNYPAPIVDHDFARKRVLEVFKKAKN